MITATRYHDFSMGHRVYQHESKCSMMHGHNYRIHFEIAAPELDKVGRVMDFSVIKEKLCVWLEANWDHRFLVWENDPWSEVLPTIDPAGCIIVPFNPTAENMAAYLVETVAPLQLEGTDCVLVRCQIEETRKCSATYFLEK